MAGGISGALVADEGVEDVGQLEAVAGVLAAGLGGEGGAGGRAVAGEDGGLGEQVGVDRLGAGGRNDPVGGKEGAAAEDEVVEQVAGGGGRGGVREPGRQRALARRVVGPRAAAR